MELLKVQGLSKSYKNFRLKEVSFTLPKGYIMGYVGQNGAGKTTTLNLITHLSKATSGTVTIDGMTYEENPTRYKEMIGYVGDESYFPPELKLRDIRDILKDFYPTFQVEKFNQLVSKWHLPANKKIRDYSRGMKVRLMFAAAFCRKTKLLILDEATNGLDPVFRADILQLLQEYIEEGETSILFSTHMLEDLQQIADYIILIDQGEIFLNETKDELLENYILIKGDKEEIPTIMRNKLLGITEGEYGFTALVSSEYAHLIPKNFLINQPTIDQIMVHMIRSRRK